jgi:hypothetical protein
MFPFVPPLFDPDTVGVKSSTLFVATKKKAKGLSGRSGQGITPFSLYLNVAKKQGGKLF